jgi:hypothetical protein
MSRTALVLWTPLVCFLICGSWLTASEKDATVQPSSTALSDEFPLLANDVFGKQAEGGGAGGDGEAGSSDKPPVADDSPPVEPDLSNATKEEEEKESESPKETIAKEEKGASEDTSVAAAPLSPAMLALGDNINRCLDFYYTRHLNSRDDSPWSVMHAFIAYGVDAQIRIGHPQGQSVNAISWVCANQPCRGQRMLYTVNGQLRGNVGPGVQGHEGQFLAYMAQSRVMIDYPIVVDGKRFTVADLIRSEMATCRAHSELTFKLIGFVHYLDTDVRWKNERGESWDIPRLIDYELAQPINGATCGGTHRMMGFSYAVRQRKRSGRPLTGQWYRAEKYVNDYHRYTLRLQNRDGSFSTIFFRGREAREDMDRRIETTGHILEWLVFSLPREELVNPPIVVSVNYLTNLMLQNRYYQWKVGPLGHAVHALALYNERVFGQEPGRRNVQLAKSDESKGG